ADRLRGPGRRGARRGQIHRAGPPEGPARPPMEPGPRVRERDVRLPARPGPRRQQARPRDHARAGARPDEPLPVARADADAAQRGRGPVGRRVDRLRQGGVRGVPPLSYKIGHTLLTWDVFAHPENIEPGIRDIAELGYAGTETGGMLYDWWEQNRSGQLKRILREAGIPMVTLFESGEWAADAAARKLLGAA